MNFQRNFSVKFSRAAIKITWLFSLILFAELNLSAQPPGRVPPPEQSEDLTWWYATLFLLGLALAGVVVWVLKTKKTDKETAAVIFRKEKIMSKDSAWGAAALEPEKDVERHGRQRKSVGQASKKNHRAEDQPTTGKIFNPKSDAGVREFSETDRSGTARNSQSDALPIFRFRKLEKARPFAPLAVSNDEALMSAVEQAYDEFEEDEQVRGLAVRILARFKTRNSVEALSQVALYDLSSNLRSKAVSILADFDHESVFEAILLCCADPTREVRAAAARELFRLSFDRSDAWTRIAETGDEFRMRQAVLAAREADLVKRSFNRLVHPDEKIAYEAVTLLALMIKAGETAEIFQAFETHNDARVKLALLQVIGLAKNESTLSKLYEMLEKNNISQEIKDKADEVIKSFDLIPA